MENATPHFRPRRRRKTRTPVVKNAEEIVNKITAEAIVGNRRKCPACGTHFNTAFANGYQSRPVCPSCWPRLSLELRMAWKAQRGVTATESKYDDLSEAIKQWFLDSPPTGEV